MALTLGKGLRLVPRTDAPGTEVDRESASIAFVGAGGKTTSIFKLPRELGRPSIVTTTTHLGTWQAKLADRHLIAQSPAELEDLGQSAVTLVTGPLGPADRLSAVSPPVLRSLRVQAQAQRWDLLIEADGARQKPLKAPGLHEPQVPQFVQTVVVVVGMHELGARLNSETIHRPEIFASVSGLGLDQVITPGSIVRVLVDRRGGLREIPSGARRLVLLNQADNEDLQAQAQGMAAHLLGAYDAVLVANMQESLVHAVYEPCAGIVLAAGGATRFGAPKQVSIWKGKPLVRIAAMSALEAGLDPVIVVTGAYSGQVNEAVRGLPVRIVENPAWKEGQGSSVRTGVAALPTRTGSAVFLLADQPLVTAAVIRALQEVHDTEDACVVAPLIDESRRGNPVLFDRETFARLREIRGEAGGRSIFPEYRIRYLPWHDSGITSDIDTPGDYQQLLESER